VNLTLLAGAVAMGLGAKVERFGWGEEIDRRLDFVPHFFGIDSPLVRLGCGLVATWTVVSILFTVRTRLRIRRDNEVRPKRMTESRRRRSLPNDR
jgi:hypothetical protein